MGQPVYFFFYLRLGVRYTDVLSLKKIWLRSCVLNSVYNLSSSPDKLVLILSPLSSPTFKIFVPMIFSASFGYIFYLVLYSA